MLFVWGGFQQEGILGFALVFLVLQGVKQYICICSNCPNKIQQLKLIKKTSDTSPHRMRTINHFVIRNGKVVSKTEAQKYPTACQPPKLNIIKPATSIIRHLDPLAYRICQSGNTNGGGNGSQNRDGSEDGELGKLRKYYEDIIVGYERKIQVLERDVQDRNQIIGKMSKDREKMLMEYADLSTARDSRQSGVSTGSELDSNGFGESVRKLVRNLDFQIQPVTKSIVDNAIQCVNPEPQEPQRQSITLSQAPSLSSIQSMQSGSSCTDTEQKTFFDTSTLMARLNKSASLVRNIKKFLEPTAGMSPKNADQQEPLSPDNSQQSESQGNVSNSQLDPNNSQFYEIELQKFIDQLVQKHEQILILLQQISQQKEQQIKQLKSHYEQVIKNMQFDRVCRHGNSSCSKNNNISNGGFSRSGSASKIVLKIATGNVEDKENKKDKIMEKVMEKLAQKQKQKEKEKEKERERSLSGRRAPLELCRSRLDDNNFEYQQKQQAQQQFF